MSTSIRNQDVRVTGLGTVEVTFSDHGEGSPFLLLHGGGGPLTLSGFADMLAAEPARSITPTHPGFAGTSRPDALNSIRGLAELYVALLDALELQGVTVVGNSMGGWIAAEMALLRSARVSGLVLVDAVGIEVPDNPVVDFFSLTPRQVAEHSYHDPDKFGIDPTKLPPEALAAMAANRAALTLYAGTAMNDPSLARRLQGVTTRTLVLWGEADRIANAGYGRAFAAAIPGARFQLLEKTGHLPQIEAPAKLLDAIREFVHDGASARPA
jgi:pimeloyl-ACP methyl ester carboxylesterase